MCGIILVRLLIIASPSCFLKKRYLYFVYKDMICSCAEISSETNNRDHSRFLNVPPVVYSGYWTGTWRRQHVVAHEAVTRGHRGVCFRSVVVNGGECRYI